MNQIYLQKPFAETLQGIIEEISTATKFPFVSIELFLEDNSLKLVHGEEPQGGGTRIELKLAPERHNAIFILAHPDKVQLADNLEQWIHHVATVLELFCESCLSREKLEADLKIAQESVLVAKNKASEAVRLIREQSALELRQMQDFYSSEALWDPKTKLPNSRLFPFLLSKRLANAKRTKQIVAVVLLEIDGFGELKINGTSFIDGIVPQISERLLRETREGDIIVYQGDGRFLWSVSNVRSAEDIATIAQKLLRALSGPYNIETNPITLSGSIGVSLFPSDGSDPKTLISNTEAALEPARKVKGNSYRFFTEGMNVKVGARLIYRKQLQQALAKQEFVLHYQPIVSVETSRIQGVEALVRWEKGGRLIYPGEFIESLCEMGLANHLDEWVVRSACSDRNLWQNEGLDLPYLALNVSSQTFWQSNFERVSALLKSLPIRPAALVLEIGEKTLMKDMEKAIAILEGFQKIGLRLSIDDFGAGSASLSYLKRYPVNFLKIDASLLRGISAGSENLAIVTAMISLAHSMNIEVIAEGIETQDELNQLRSLGCDSFQGILNCPPLTRDLFKEVLKKQKTKTVEPKVVPQQPAQQIIASPATNRPVIAVPEVQQAGPLSGRSVYNITCFNCHKTYNAMEATWCRCLSSEQTLHCPHCNRCFCRATLEYRHHVWDNGPEGLWERKRENERAFDGIPENLPPSQVKSPRVLVVDDEKHILKMASRLITEMGYSVILARNGLEGLDVAKTYAPQLILTDALMPKMDGREMCRLLKLDPKTARTKMIIMTAFTGTAAKYKPVLKSDSFEEYVQKPIEIEKLRYLLKKYL